MTSLTTLARIPTRDPCGAYDPADDRIGTAMAQMRTSARMI